MLEEDQKALVKTNGYLVQSMLELELKQTMTGGADTKEENSQEVISELKKQLEEKDKLLKQAEEKPDA